MLNRRDAMKGVAAGIAAVGVCPAVAYVWSKCTTHRSGDEEIGDLQSLAMPAYGEDVDDMEKHPEYSRNNREMDCESYLWSQHFDLNLEGWLTI